MTRFALILALFAATPVLAQDATPRPVVTEIVSADIASHRAFTGLIEPRTETDLAFRVGGRLATLSVDQGDRVIKGAVLAELDQITLQQDFLAATAGVDSARAAADLALSQFDRATELAARGVYSDAQLEAISANNDAAIAQLENANATLRQATEAAQYGQLTAPYDGIVLARKVEVGSTVNAGAAILTLSDLSGLEAVIDMPTAILDLLPDDAMFDIQHHTSGIAPVTAQLRLVDPVAEGRLDTRRLRLTLIDPPEDYRIGALVTAAPIGDNAPFVTLPTNAILDRDGTFGVWAVTSPDRSVHFTPVTQGAELGDRTVITQGVRIGDEIITRGVHALTEGQIVGDHIE